jgi:hypothetical protein
MARPERSCGGGDRPVVEAIMDGDVLDIVLCL